LHPCARDIAIRPLFCHTPRLRTDRLSGLPWRFVLLNQQTTTAGGLARAPSRCVQESQMPKMKTKSGAKKRFKITGTGKVMYAQRGKRHGMIKRTNKQIRNLRGTAVLFEGDAVKVKKFWMPHG
jgi:large subunit ribosomal protein L35